VCVNFLYASSDLTEKNMDAAKYIFRQQPNKKAPRGSFEKKKNQSITE
jgi:hypothetical protein